MKIEATDDLRDVVLEREPLPDRGQIGGKREPLTRAEQIRLLDPGRGDEVLVGREPGADRERAGGRGPILDYDRRDPRARAVDLRRGWRRRWQGHLRNGCLG